MKASCSRTISLWIIVTTKTFSIKIYYLIVFKAKQYSTKGLIFLTYNCCSRNRNDSISNRQCVSRGESREGVIQGNKIILFIPLSLDTLEINKGGSLF